MEQMNVSAEIERRCMPIYMDIGLHRGKFKYRNLLQHLQDNRSLYLSAFFTLIKDWVKNGMNMPDEPNKPSFESWVSCVNGVLQNAGYDQFLFDGFSLKQEAREAVTNLVQSGVEASPDSIISSESLASFINKSIPKSAHLESDSLVLNDVMLATFNSQATKVIENGQEILVFKGVDFVKKMDEIETILEEKMT